MRSAKWNQRVKCHREEGEPCRPHYVSPVELSPGSARVQLGGRSFVSIHKLHEKKERSLQPDEGCTLECLHEAFLLALRNSFFPPPQSMQRASLDTRQILIEPRLKDLASARCVTEADVSSVLAFHFPNDMAGSLSLLITSTFGLFSCSRVEQPVKQFVLEVIFKRTRVERENIIARGRRKKKN